VFQARGERRRLLSVDPRHAWVQGRQRRLGQSSRQGRFPRLQRNHGVFDRERGHAGLDRLNDLLNLPLNVGELAARARHLSEMFATQARELRRESLTEGGEGTRFKEPLAHGAQHARFDVVPLDVAVVITGAALAGVETRQPVVGGKDKAAATGSTLSQAGE
jgi:hypothetical protein